jgi:hypothetical protein
VLDAPIYDGPRARTTLERRHQIHGLLEKGVGLLECARRLQLALNTVKRYARADRPERMLRVPRYRASLVDPYREHLRKYVNQGRADADRSHIWPRRLARMLLARPDNLKAEHHELLAGTSPRSLRLTPTTSTRSRTGQPGSATPTCLTCMPSPEVWNEIARPWTQPSRFYTATAPPRVSTPRQSASRARCTDEQASLCSATASSSDNSHPGRPPKVRQGREAGPLD